MTKEQFKHRVQLTKNNIQSLLKGGRIRLKSSQLGGGDHELIFHSKRKHQKLQKCNCAKKGTQIHLSEKELADTLQGGSFKSWWHKKASPWLRRAGHDLWRGVRGVTRDMQNIGRYGAYRGIDTAAEVAPIVVQGAFDAQNPMAAISRNVGKTVVGLANAASNAMAPAPATLGKGIEQGYPQPRRRRGTLNPADNVQSHVDTGLYGVHNHTPDHVLHCHGGGFLPSSHPASRPTLLFRDPMSRIEFGSVLSEGHVGLDENVHPALNPGYDNLPNLVNTGATLRHGGSFRAVGEGIV